MLFCQLGLAGDEEQINAFIEKHRPLPCYIALSGADFWNEAQATALCTTGARLYLRITRLAIFSQYVPTSNE